MGAVPSIKVLLVDDHHLFREGLRTVLASAEDISVVGCVVLFLYLPRDAKLVFPIWAGIGLFFYYIYGYRKSHMRPGNAPVDDDAPVLPAAPVFHEGPEPGP